MTTRYLTPKSATWRSIVVALSLMPAAWAQKVAAPTDPKPEEPAKLEKFVVTGSAIKRIEGEGALPLEIIRPQQMEEVGIASAEQMVMALNINGNGLDNLASNADVTAGAQRGFNGITAANLRMQGANATLVLLNGRRIAAAGLNGGVVDLNSIPFAAIERVEVLKDGASAIYGTDAIGGVINFITKTNFQGVSASAASDITQEGGGNIFRYSLVAGFGDLNRDKFNIMTTLSQSDNKRLRGDQRSWNSAFQSARGESPDTRGAPVANAFAISSLYSALSRDNVNTAGRSAGPLDPNNAAVTLNGISIVGLPGGPAYSSLTGVNAEQPYDYLLWASPGAKYGSAWDTGRAAILQQPVRNTNSVTRGIYKLGEHRITGEVILGRSESNKSFSPNQISSSTAVNTTAPDGVTTVPNPFFNLAYPSTGSDYSRVFGILSSAFPSLAANNGLPLAFRWRAMPMGNREIHSKSDSYRMMVSAEGPLPFLSEWEYRTGVSRSSSKSSSVLNHGYFYSVPFAALINTGVVNPFSATQTAAALTALDATRADGVKLYGGTSTTDEADATFSGPLFKLPAGKVQAALGLDTRTEKYFFAGDQRPNVNSASSIVFNAPFDNTLATAGTLKRNIDAIFTEVQVPILKDLDFNGAVRTDRYTGFGTTTNPKITLRYAPSDQILFRSSYSTGFRVPTFKQIFDPFTVSTYVGNDFADPKFGPYNIVDAAHPAVHPDILTGGNRNLQPEKAKMISAGFVFAPTRHFSGNLDFWAIKRDGTIQLFGQTVLAQSYSLFTDRFIRDSAGNLLAIDTRWVNAGQTVTRGIEFGLKGDTDIAEGKLSGGLDVSYLLEKKSKLLATAPFGASEINQFTRASDLGLRWKHTAYVSYSRGKWSATVNQLYRNRYLDAVLPGVANGTVVPPLWNPTVKAYDIFGASVTYRGIKHMTITAGIKNIFNTKPPFSAVYDTNTGAGSDWEPRIADPRDRSFTTRVDYNFF